MNKQDLMKKVADKVIKAMDNQWKQIMYGSDGSVFFTEDINIEKHIA